MKSSYLRRLMMLWILLLTIIKIQADIAPSPITANGVRTTDSCNIQMISEYVYADLYQNYAKVECTFELLNSGDSITIQIGFPEMHFQYHHIGMYNEDEKINYTIEVDGKILTKKDIKLSKELDSAVTAYKKNCANPL